MCTESLSSIPHIDAQGHSPDVLDGTALEQLHALGVLKKVGTLYLNLAPEIVEEICAAIDGDDLEVVIGGCHKLKSSSANVGAIEFADICKQMENAAKRGEIQTCRLLRPEFMDCHAQAMTALQTCVAAT